MNDLKRELAPITTEAWSEIDEEARRTLALTLAGRKIVDFTGPLGWDAAAIGTGRVDLLTDSPGKGVAAAARRSLPLIELKIPFELPRTELDAIARGAQNADLDAVVDAARKIALAEDKAIFHGFAAGAITGICQAAEASALTLSSDYLAYPAVVAEAVSTLQTKGVGGPFAIALGPRCWMGLTKTTGAGGHPVLEHVRRLINGPVVWAPGVDGAVIASLRGGDFELIVGRDLSIGYLDHTADSVRLYLEESLTFRVHTAEAAIPLTYR